MTKGKRDVSKIDGKVRLTGVPSPLTTPANPLGGPLHARRGKRGERKRGRGTERHGNGAPSCTDMCLAARVCAAQHDSHDTKRVDQRVDCHVSRVASATLATSSHSFPPFSLSLSLSLSRVLSLAPWCFWVAVGVYTDCYFFCLSFSTPLGAPCPIRDVSSGSSSRCSYTVCWFHHSGVLQPEFLCFPVPSVISPVVFDVYSACPR